MAPRPPAYLGAFDEVPPSERSSSRARPADYSDIYKVASDVRPKWAGYRYATKDLAVKLAIAVQAKEGYEALRRRDVVYVRRTDA